MTVKELIESLEDFPSNAEVEIKNAYDGVPVYGIYENNGNVIIEPYIS